MPNPNTQDHAVGNQMAERQADAPAEMHVSLDTAPWLRFHDAVVLIVAEGGHGVDAGGAAGGKIGRQERDGEDRGAGEGQGDQ